jgi:hypothetical protein
MKPSLKRETIKGILTENAFNMSRFGDAKELTRKKGIPTQKNGCGTACCIAGHIVSAAKRLDLPMLTPAQAIRAELLAYRRSYGVKLTAAQTKLADRVVEHDTDCDPVAIMAREVWAQQYGSEAARKLDFYANSVDDIHTMEHITAESAVAHIRTGAPLEVRAADEDE